MSKYEELIAEFCLNGVEYMETKHCVKAVEDVNTLHSAFLFFNKINLEHIALYITIQITRAGHRLGLKGTLLYTSLFK